jgi:hypothetical protein
MFEIRLKAGTRYRIEVCTLRTAKLTLEAVECHREAINENAWVVLVAGTYELAPDGNVTNSSSLLENGVNFRVVTSPGSLNLRL